MNGKKSKKLRKIAQSIGIGQSPQEVYKIYSRLKTIKVNEQKSQNSSKTAK